MKKFINESWNEYLELLKTVVPQNIQDKLIKNKSKYIKLLVTIILIEIVLLISYNVFVSSPEVNNKVDLNKTKDVSDG